MNLKIFKKNLINNGFPNYIVDTEIKHFINKTEEHNIDNIVNHKQPINLYYKNNFKVIIRWTYHKKPYPKNVPPTDPIKKIRFIIYYNFKTPT